MWAGRHALPARIRIGTIDEHLARFRKRQAQFWLKPHDLAPFALPGAPVPHVEWHVLIEAIGVTDDEDAVVPM